MIEAIIITIFPVLFLIVLFGGGAVFRRKKIDMDEEAPIIRVLFYTAKYSIIVLWAAMALQSWGVNLSFVVIPLSIQWIALFLRVFGSTLLFLGRFGLGRSFRLGTPRERTSLTVGGVYRFSRNPMYLGVYATVLAR